MHGALSLDTIQAKPVFVGDQVSDLAVRDHAHATTPNGRCADLVAQRPLKASIADRAAPCPYAEPAALLLESRVGERFDTLITGVSDRGTWIRLLDVERGSIDFRAAGAAELLRDRPAPSPRT